MGRRRSEKTGKSFSFGGGGGRYAARSETPLTPEELKFLELLKVQALV